jgi:hypothetical protein
MVYGMNSYDDLRVLKLTSRVDGDGSLTIDNVLGNSSSEAGCGSARPGFVSSHIVSSHLRLAHVFVNTYKPGYNTYMEFRATFPKIRCQRFLPLLQDVSVGRGCPSHLLDQTERSFPVLPPLSKHTSLDRLAETLPALCSHHVMCPRLSLPSGCCCVYLPLHLVTVPRSLLEMHYQPVALLSLLLILASPRYPYEASVTDSS